MPIIALIIEEKNIPGFVFTLFVIKLDVKNAKNYVMPTKNIFTPKLKPTLYIEPCIPK